MPKISPFLEFSPEKTLFILLSFEGPDLYSRAGGLGVRMSELSNALALAGYTTHLFFVGDPDLPGEEKLLEGRLLLHRWCQWISRYHPRGVYDGEEGKRRDYEKSIPPWLIEEIVRKNRDKTMVILSEEWHTAGTVLQLRRQIFSHPGASDATKIFLLWNANNTFGFHRIPWKPLDHAAVITTVSRYMKHLLREKGVEPLVIPNGIPKRWLAPVKPSRVKELRKSVTGDLLLVKVGRFDPDKEWTMAVEAVAILKNLGFKPRLLMRGGIEPHGEEVRRLAQKLGLGLVPVQLSKNASLAELLQFFRREKGADIYDLQFFVPEEMLRLLYRAADAVLANSRHEPFGLVGLEVMASQGVAVTGSTGEDYALNFQNALVMDTTDPWELAASLAFLALHPELSEKLRQNGKTKAESFQWNHVIEEVKRKLAYLSFSGKNKNETPWQRKGPLDFETFRHG